jgi:hypothetical protein
MHPTDVITGRQDISERPQDMSHRRLERAIELGKRTEHFFVTLMGEGGFPYINSAHQIEPVAENQFAIEEWICPLTVQQLSGNPKIGVLIWDPAADDGYEILGEVLMFDGQAFLNGFAPEIEESAYLPQVKRKLIVRAERIAAFSHALRCDEIQQLPAAASLMNPPTDNVESEEVPLCSFAPEWAEHARLSRGDEPCDDGRAGDV